MTNVHNAHLTTHYLRGKIRVVKTSNKMSLGVLNMSLPVNYLARSAKMVFLKLVMLASDSHAILKTVTTVLGLIFVVFALKDTHLMSKQINVNNTKFKERIAQRTVSHVLMVNAINVLMGIKFMKDIVFANSKIVWNVLGIRSVLSAHTPQSLV